MQAILISSTNLDGQMYAEKCIGGVWPDQQIEN